MMRRLAQWLSLLLLCIVAAAQAFAWITEGFREENSFEMLVFAVAWLTFEMWNKPEEILGPTTSNQVVKQDASK